jgi:hypothetical protein
MKAAVHFWVSHCTLLNISGSFWIQARFYISMQEGKESQTALLSVPTGEHKGYSGRSH